MAPSLLFHISFGGLAALSLVVKLHMYINQVRKRKAEANPLWVEAVGKFSPRQKKIVKLQEKLDETTKVVPP